MKFGKTLKVMALVMIVVGVVWAAAAPFNVIDESGIRVLGLTSTGATSDTGVGFYTITIQDSAAAGVFLLGAPVNAGSIISGNADTALALPGVGLPRRIYGSAAVSGAIARTSLFIPLTDTARIDVSLTASNAAGVDSHNAIGSWASSLTGGSGAARDSFRYATSFAAQNVVFGDSTGALPLFPLSNQIRALGATTWARKVDTNIAIIFGTGNDSAAPNDTARLIAFGPAGNLITDTVLRRMYSNDSTFATVGTISFDSGTTDIYVIYWSDSVSKLALHHAAVTVGNAVVNLISTTQTVAVSAMGSISSAALTVVPSAPQVNQVQITDIGGDGAARSDAFARFDTNTAGFDTRLSNTVFEMKLRAAGEEVTRLAAGQDYLVVIGYNFSALSPTVANSIKLLRLNPQTERWEVARDGNGSTAHNNSDSTNSRVVARVSEFSIFALGAVAATAVAADAEDDQCVIDATLGRSGLAGVMPALRGARDSIMDSVLGRFLVSSYYGLGLALLLFTGAGLAYVRRR